MAKKPARRCKTKTVSKKRVSIKRELISRKRIHQSIWYAVYLLVFLVFLASFIAGTFGDDDDSGSGCGGGCDGCDGCGCDDEEDSDDDGDASSEDSILPITDPGAPVTPPVSTCQRNVYADGNLDNDFFSYTFVVNPCEDIVVDVYLMRTTGDNYDIYESRDISQGRSLSGSGRKPKAENFNKICIKVDNETPCCSANGRIDC